MKIITTPMCEDILRIAGLTDYEVVNPSEIKNADIAILLSETRSDIPKISVKLNTFTQIYESVLLVSDRFKSDIDEDEVSKIKFLIDENNNKKDNRRNTKVKVYSNFLKDTLLDMGFTIGDTDYDFIVMPDYLDVDLCDDRQIVTVPSHKNVSKNILERVKERYDLLERKICMKQ